MSAESEVLLRFSLKEGLYKAIHPFVRRYVAFKEVRPPTLSRHKAILSEKTLRRGPAFSTDLLSTSTHTCMQAEATPRADGTVSFTLHLKNSEGPFHAEGTWRRVENGQYFLTAVKVQASQPASAA